MVFLNGLLDMHCFSDLLALNLLLPYIGDIKTVKKSGIRAILISAAALVLICLSYGLTYPYPYSKEFLLIPSEIKLLY